MVKQNAPVCQVCQQILSTEHLLLICRVNFNKRREFGLVNAAGFPKELKDILGRNIDIERIMLFIEFLCQSITIKYSTEMHKIT